MQGTQLARATALVMDPAAKPGSKVGRKPAQDLADGSTRDSTAARPAEAKPDDARQADPKQAVKGREDGSGANPQGGGQRRSKARTSGDASSATPDPAQAQVPEAANSCIDKAFADLVKEFGGFATQADSAPAGPQEPVTAATPAEDATQAALMDPSGANLAAMLILAAAAKDAEKAAAVPQGRLGAAVAALSAKPIGGDAGLAGPIDVAATKAAAQIPVNAKLRVTAEQVPTDPEAELSQDPTDASGGALTPTDAASLKAQAQAKAQARNPNQASPLAAEQPEPEDGPEESALSKARPDGQKAAPVSSDGKKPPAAASLASAFQAVAALHQAQGLAAPMARAVVVAAKTPENHAPTSTIAQATTHESSASVQVGQTSFDRTLRQTGAEPSVADQVVESVRTGGQAASREITIQLTPPDLGRVRITFREDGDGIVGTMEVTNVKALQQLEHEGQSLALRLAESGVSLKSVEVVLNPQGDGQSTYQGGGSPFLADGGDGRQASSFGGRGEAEGHEDPASDSGRGGATAEPALAMDGSRINVEA